MSELNLVIRPARPGDRDRVLAFTANTWEGGDYIDDVFEEWLRDAAGRFTVAELDNQPVAIGKLTDQGEGELWLEGLRVDPAYRKRGIGEALHQHLLRLAQAYGGRALRYATGHGNVVSLMLGERTGFRRIGEYGWHAADASNECAPPERLTADDGPTLKSWLDSRLMQSVRGLYVSMWKWSRLSAARLQKHLEAGEVFGLRGPSGLRAWSICARVEDWDEASLYHLDGDDRESLEAIAQSMRRLAADAGCRSVAGFALASSPIADALLRAGYHHEDHTMVVLERSLDKR
jgi:GNAT superfamily N-acetyltransferase